MDITVIELEDKIRKMVAEDNKRIAIFEYSTKAGIVEREILTVSTFNSETKEVTVMYTTEAQEGRKDCLAEVIKYLEITKPSICPFTMRWKKKGPGEESTLSYFHCNDMQEVLDKFFANRNKKEYVIFSLEMKGCE